MPILKLSENFQVAGAGVGTHVKHSRLNWVKETEFKGTILGISLNPMVIPIKF